MGLCHVLGLDAAETNLDGIVAVGRLSFNLRDGAGASLDDRDGDDVVVLVPHLGHTDLAAENHADHSMILTLGGLGTLRPTLADAPSGPLPTVCACVAVPPAWPRNPI